MKKTDALFVVDAISALVAHDIRTDEWGIDVMIGGSQKGVMLPPGLAFVSVSDKAWKMADTAKTPKFYFNFKKERENLAKNQTNFTSAVTLIIGLNACIKMLQEEGLENVLARHEKLARATRAAGGGARASSSSRRKARATRSRPSRRRQALTARRSIRTCARSTASPARAARTSSRARSSASRTWAMPTPLT